MTTRVKSAAPQQPTNASATAIEMTPGAQFIGRANSRAVAGTEAAERNPP